MHPRATGTAPTLHPTRPRSFVRGNMPKPKGSVHTADEIARWVEAAVHGIVHALQLLRDLRVDRLEAMLSCM